MSAREEAPERPNDPLCGGNADLDSTKGEDCRDDTATKEDGGSLQRSDASGEIGTGVGMSGREAHEKEGREQKTETHDFTFFFLRRN